MYILVTKGIDKKVKNPIQPKSVPLTSPTTYLFVAGSDKIGLRTANLDQILEITKPQIVDSFGDRFNDAEEDDNNVGKAPDKNPKNTNKL